MTIDADKNKNEINPYATPEMLPAKLKAIKSNSELCAIVGIYDHKTLQKLSWLVDELQKRHGIDDIGISDFRAFFAKWLRSHSQLTLSPLPSIQDIVLKTRDVVTLSIFVPLLAVSLPFVVKHARSAWMEFLNDFRKEIAIMLKHPRIFPLERRIDPNALNSAEIYQQ